MTTIKYLLDEDQMPRAWYNIQADLPQPAPAVLHPGTMQPIGPDDLAPLFPMSLIEQEVSTEREIPIPEPVRDVLRMWRPAPLHRALGLERALGTPAKIFYKYEGVSPAGSHKPNTAIPQAFYNKEAGVRRLTTETGAGQWGTSLAFAGSLFDLDVQIFQVRVSYDQKPYRRAVMETYGARCVPSPSMETDYGRRVLAERPDHPGSLGIAISEAVEIAAQRDDTKYALGSVLNHVLLHQTVIGLEAMQQMEMADTWPDVVLSCTGGGSNFAGIAFPFIGHGLRGGPKPRIVAVEPAACPTLTRGKYAYDFGDTAHLTPLTKMHTLGSTFTTGLPCRRVALPRHGAAGVARQGVGLDGGRGLRPGRMLCCGCAVCAARRHRSCSRVHPCHQGRDRRSPALQARRQGGNHSVLPEWPRPFRHDRLYQIPGRPAQG